MSLTNAAIREAINAAGLPGPEPGKLHLLGLRSADGRVTDRFDDKIGVFGSALQFWPGTTDPGRFYTRTPLHPRGTAHLVAPGCYLYRRGLHKGKPALVQAGDVKVWRDRDRDGGRDPNELAEVVNGIGLNLHRMGPRASGIVGRWSAGCQGMAEADFLDFLAVLDQHPQGVYRYYLLAAAAL